MRAAVGVVHHTEDGGTSPQLTSPSHWGVKAGYVPFLLRLTRFLFGETRFLRIYLQQH